MSYSPHIPKRCYPPPPLQYRSEKVKKICEWGGGGGGGGVYIIATMENKDQNADFQKVVRVFIPGVFKS